MTNSGVQNRLQDKPSDPHPVTNSYIEGDVDIVSGRGAVVFDNTDFRVVNSRTQKEAWRLRAGYSEERDLRLPRRPTAASPPPG